MNRKKAKKKGYISTDQVITDPFKIRTKKSSKSTKNNLRSQKYINEVVLQQVTNANMEIEDAIAYLKASRKGIPSKTTIGDNSYISTNKYRTSLRGMGPANLRRWHKQVKRTNLQIKILEKVKRNRDQFEKAIANGDIKSAKKIAKNYKDIAKIGRYQRTPVRWKRHLLMPGIYLLNRITKKLFRTMKITLGGKSSKLVQDMMNKAIHGRLNNIINIQKETYKKDLEQMQAGKMSPDALMEKQFKNIALNKTIIPALKVKGKVKIAESVTKQSIENNLDNLHNLVNNLDPLKNPKHMDTMKQCCRNLARLENNLRQGRLRGGKYVKALSKAKRTALAKRAKNLRLAITKHGKEIAPKVRENIRAQANEAARAREIQKNVRRQKAKQTSAPPSPRKTKPQQRQATKTSSKQAVQSPARKAPSRPRRLSGQGRSAESPPLPPKKDTLRRRNTVASAGRRQSIRRNQSNPSMEITKQRKPNPD